MIKVGDVVISAKGHYIDSYTRHTGELFRYLETNPQVVITITNLYDDKKDCTIQFSDHQGRSILYTACLSDFKLKKKPSVIIG